MLRIVAFVILTMMSFSVVVGQSSWARQKSDCLPGDKPPGVLVAGHFFDENDGWVVGETGELRSGSVRIGFSNGLSRCVRSVGSVLSGYDDVTFSDTKRGWIAGSAADKDGKVRAVLLETNNGGTSWTAVEISSLFPDSNEQTDIDVVVYAKSTLYLLAKKGDSAGENVKGLILRGSLDGKLWETVSITAQDVFFQDVAFDDSGQYGWAITNRGAIYNSRDWGRTWAERTFKFREPLLKVFAIDSLAVWVTTQSSSLLHSVDGGINWTTCDVKVDKEIGKKYAVWFSGIFFKGKMNGWVGGSGGLIMRTADGGDSWKMDSYGLSSFIYEIQPAGKNLIAVGKSELLVMKPE